MLAREVHVGANSRPTDARDLREGVGAGSGHGRAVLSLVLMIGK